MVHTDTGLKRRDLIRLLGVASAAAVVVPQVAGCAVDDTAVEPVVNGNPSVELYRKIAADVAKLAEERIQQSPILMAIQEKYQGQPGTGFYPLLLRGTVDPATGNYEERIYKKRYDKYLEPWFVLQDKDHFTLYDYNTTYVGRGEETSEGYDIDAMAFFAHEIAAFNDADKNGEKRLKVQHLLGGGIVKAKLFLNGSEPFLQLSKQSSYCTGARADINRAKLDEEVSTQGILGGSHIGYLEGKRLCDIMDTNLGENLYALLCDIKGMTIDEILHLEK